ncbi:MULTISPECIES: Mu transposase C-terminal domain-containing protein [Nostoc]|uniref:DDE-type integrase/transposase/recombinase n=2 Tax=Nostoc TaxID=1177 RepID=A0ABR8ICW2_9NOSO|nr:MULTISPECIES: Mu transposase C-terminal domain-containing protein [Nostoc]MBD2560256.1 DDE-type integrase/transposase/recombinase [Nostoc linckia FACHB-391]MBD2648762.1 DDE-type integrase/transposase/recombinase [Nostoc foliaceum FACHB-393]
MSPLDVDDQFELEDQDSFLSDDEYTDTLDFSMEVEPLSENDNSVEEDKSVEFLDQRFLEDSKLRLSGEQRLKLEIIRNLREPCDRLTYGKRLEEAAKKLGKSERTVRRLIKSWEEKGMAALAEVPRADKGQVRKSEYWYNLSLKIYKQGNKGSDRMTRTQVAEKIETKAYEFAKKELEAEISRLESQGFRGEDLDRQLKKLIKIKEKAEGFKYWSKYGKPPSTRTVERWLKPVEEKRHKSRISRSPGWHGSEHIIKTRDGQEISIKYSNQVWQIDHTKADILLVDEDGEEIGRPQLTTVIDCYSRCIVGLRLGLAAPSSQVVALALRNAIMPKRYASEYELRCKWSAYGVPKYVYTDGGKDFRSKHLVEWIANELDFEPILRSQPSDGGIVERPFRTMSGLLSEMPGYTGSSVKDRPEGAEDKACISLPELEKLIIGYIVDSYNQKPDARSQANPLTPKQSRIERWEKGLQMTPTLLNDRELDICLMKAAERVVYDNGYLNFSGLRYRGENLGAYAGEKVVLRFDPRDITMMLVYGRKNNKEIFLARAYAVGLEAERLSVEEVKYARKKAENSGKGINNVSILEEAIRRRNFLKHKKSKTKAERRRAEQERIEPIPQRYEEKGNEQIERLVFETEADEPIEKVDFKLLREELGL